MDLLGQGLTLNLVETREAVVDPLFAPPALGGLGMRKLEFYGPRLFRLLPHDPARGRAGSLALSTPDVKRLCSTLPNPPGNSG